MAIIYTGSIKDSDGEYTAGVEEPRRKVTKALAGACVALTLSQVAAVASMVQRSEHNASVLAGSPDAVPTLDLDEPEIVPPPQLVDPMTTTNDLQTNVAEAVAANTPEKLPDLGVPWMLPTVKYYSPQIIAAANEFGINPRQIAIQMALESAGYRNIPPSKDNARGLMQFIPSTEAAVAAQLGLSEGSYDITDPATATRFAAKLISNLQNTIKLTRQVNGLPPPTEYELVTMSAAGYHSGDTRAAELAINKNNLKTYGQNYLDNVGAMWNELGQFNSSTLERLWPGKLEPNVSKAIADFEAQGIDIYALIP